MAVNYATAYIIYQQLVSLTSHMFKLDEQNTLITCQSVKEASGDLSCQLKNGVAWRTEKNTEREHEGKDSDPAFPIKSFGFNSNNVAVSTTTVELWSEAWRVL